MSYDVDAGGEWSNYTSNLGRFFKDFGVYPPDWAGKHRYEVADQIDAALEKIAVFNRPALEAEYDSPNGWGSVESAIGWLEKVRAACVKELPDKVEVSW